MPEEIPLLVKPIVQGRADFVAGNRFSNGVKPENMPKSKYLGNKLGAKVISSITNQKFDDVTCGFRAYSREAMLHININSKYTYTQEVFQLMASKKLDIVQVPITIKYYKGRKSRVVKSVSGFITNSAFNILRAFRDFEPMKFFGTLSLIPLILGLICLIFVLIYWISTGSITPYKTVGFVGIYLVSLSIVVGLFGLLSDMLGRIVNTQEKTLYYEKKSYYSKFKKSSK